jgi:hypothetical protein
MKLCLSAHQQQQSKLYIEPNTRLLFYAVYSPAVECDNDAILPVHEVRYGSTVRAPARLMGVINQTICSVLAQTTTHPDLTGVVLCGFHAGAVVAYCTSVCVQRIIACNNLHASQLLDMHCVTFGLPLYYVHPTHSLTDQTHLVMHDDWFVLTPFTIVLQPVPGLCWIGTEDLVGYVCTKIESLFRTVRSQRTMRDYINAFVVEYEEVLSTHCDELVIPPPSSPNDAVEPESSVDSDWVDCVDGVDAAHDVCASHDA